MPDRTKIIKTIREIRKENRDEEIWILNLIQKKIIMNIKTC